MEYNGITIRTNQVWRTKSGRLALIIDSSECLQDGERLGMLWHDHIDKEYTVTPIWTRLNNITDLTVNEFWQETCPHSPR